MMCITVSGPTQFPTVYTVRLSQKELSGRGIKVTSNFRPELRIRICGALPPFCHLFMMLCLSTEIPLLYLQICFIKTEHDTLHPANTKAAVLTIVIFHPHPQGTEGGSMWGIFCVEA
jgi:hypothetical protein